MKTMMYVAAVALMAVCGACASAEKSVADGAAKEAKPAAEAAKPAPAAPQQGQTVTVAIPAPETLKGKLSEADYAAYEAAVKTVTEVQTQFMAIMQEVQKDVGALGLRYEAEKKTIEEKYKNLKDDPLGRPEYEAAVKALDAKFQPMAREIEGKYNPRLVPLGQKRDAALKTIEELKAKAAASAQ